MVQRYIADCEGSDADGYESVQRCADGDFVTYKDYAELERRIAELEKQRDGLVAELNAVENIHADAVFITDDDYDKCPDGVKKVISSLAVMSLPASKVAIAEIGAKAVEKLISDRKREWLESYIDDARQFANKLRGGGV